MHDFSFNTALYNSVKIPWISFGTHTLHNEETDIPLIKNVLANGYHAIDIASIYKNEEIIGKAIRDSSIKREEILLTMKVAPTDYGYTSTLASFRTSMIHLQVDYIDLYLLHWPQKRLYKDSWRALEKLYRDGFVRAIGVCNFSIPHLKELMESSTIQPMVNQVNFHPRTTQQALHTFCQNHDIQLQAYNPLAQSRSILAHPLVQQLANLYNKTPAQIILRWHLQHHIPTVLSTTNLIHLSENKQIFNFELTLEDVITINKLYDNIQIARYFTKSRYYLSLHLSRYAEKLKKHLQC
jgi:methylglyoxal/glyoxal reductase